MVKPLRLPLLITTLWCTGCDGGTPPPETVTLGYSSPGDVNTWFASFAETLQAAADDEGYELIVRHTGDVAGETPADRAARQSSQVAEMLDADIDVLIFGPITAGQESMDMIGLANERDVPVIVVNRDPEDPIPEESDAYFSRILSDFYGFGYEMCGEHMREAIPAPAQINILRVNGTLSASNTTGYQRGCDDAIADLAEAGDTNIAIVHSIDGNFNQGEARAAALADMEQITTLGVNMVFSMSDMSLGVIEAMEDAGGLVAGTDFFVISADADPGQHQAILDGKIFGVMTTSPYYGDQVVAAVRAHLAGESVAPFVPVADFFIDASNANDDARFPF